MPVTTAKGVMEGAVTAVPAPAQRKIPVREAISLGGCFICGDPSHKAKGHRAAARATKAAVAAPTPSAPRHRSPASAAAGEGEPPLKKVKITKSKGDGGWMVEVVLQ